MPFIARCLKTIKRSNRHANLGNPGYCQGRLVQREDCSGFQARRSFTSLHDIRTRCFVGGSSKLSGCLSLLLIL